MFILARGMGVASIALGVLSLFVLGFGMESIPFGGERSQKV